MERGKNYLLESAYRREIECERAIDAVIAILSGIGIAVFIVFAITEKIA